MRRIAAVAALFALVPAAAAQAHTELENAAPAAHEALDAPPRAVRLTFSEPVETPSDALRVTDADGRSVGGAVRAAGPVVAVRLPARLDAGKYRVTWRVVSDDGHVLDGTYRFKIRAASSGTTRPAQPAAVPAALPARAEGRAPLGTMLVLGGLATAVAALVGGMAVRRRAPARKAVLADVALLTLGLACAVPLFVVAIH